MFGGYLCASCVPAGCCAGAQWKLYFLCISELKLLFCLLKRFMVAVENLSCMYASDVMTECSSLFIFNTLVLLILIYKSFMCSCIHLCVNFLFLLLFDAQHASNEVHNVVVLVGIVFEIHMKDVENVRFHGS
jgi:hypothetical protein